MQLVVFFLLKMLVFSESVFFPAGLERQKQESESSASPRHPPSNSERKTELPSATNLGQTKAKSARISHYTCFPLSLSPECTSERRDFHLLRQWCFKPHKDHIFSPHSHCRSARYDRRDETWRSCWRDAAEVEIMMTFFLSAATCWAQSLQKGWNVNEMQSCHLIPGIKYCVKCTKTAVHLFFFPWMKPQSWARIVSTGKGKENVKGKRGMLLCVCVCVWGGGVSS